MLTKVFIFGIYIHMKKSSKKRFINALKKNGWRVESREECDSLTLGEITVICREDRWELYYLVSGELTFGVSYSYGLRQSQILKREVLKYQQWRDDHDGEGSELVSV